MGGLWKLKVGHPITLSPSPVPKYHRMAMDLVLYSFLL